MRKLLFLLTVIPCVASASDWVFLHKSAYSVVPGRHMTSEIYVDRNSVATDGNVKTVWWKNLMTANGGEPLDILTLGMFDCKRHTYRLEDELSRTTGSEQYTSKWAKIGSVERRIMPDDNEDFVFSAVCLNKWKQG